MGRQYIFKIRELSLSTYSDHDGRISSDCEIAIQISESDCDSFNIAILLNFLSDIKLFPFIETSYFIQDLTVTKTDDEHIGYLKGYFGFKSKEDIDNSLKILIDNLNGKYPERNYYKKSWNIFTDTFNQWYQDKLKPCLQQDINLLIKYHKEI